MSSGPARSLCGLPRADDFFTVYLHLHVMAQHFSPPFFPSKLIYQAADQ